MPSCHRASSTPQPTPDCSLRSCGDDDSTEALIEASVSLAAAEPVAGVAAPDLTGSMPAPYRPEPTPIETSPPAPPPRA